jgi:cytochrome b561
MKTILVSRYHPLLVTLHWLLAVPIVAKLCVGFLLLAEMPNDDPQKIGVLLIHMSVGMAILALMVVRLVVRWRTSKPAEATAGHRLLDRLALITHYGFYVLVLLMVGTGYATGILAGLNRSVFLLHLLAALYHQFIRRDRLLQRMWFGRRDPDPSA